MNSAVPVPVYGLTSATAIARRVMGEGVTANTVVPAGVALVDFD